jgi:hypothetical protein
MKYPRDIFSSQQEFEGYLKCLRKAQLGDVIHFYCENNPFNRLVSPTMRKTDCIAFAPIIARNNEYGYNYPILGQTNNDQVRFHPIRDGLRISEQVDNFGEYTHLFCVRVHEFSDLLVHKIERRKNNVIPANKQ